MFNHQWNDQDKCEKCDDRDWYAEDKCRIPDEIKGFSTLLMFFRW